MNIFIILGIFFLFALILTVTLVIIYWDSMPPVTLPFILGQYHCRKHEVYRTYPVRPVPFMYGQYQPINAAYLAVFNYNISVDPCKDKEFPYPPDILNYKQDIYVDGTRHASIFYYGKTMLVYMQSMKYKDILYDTLKIWKTEYLGGNVYSGLFNTYNKIREQLQSIIVEQLPNKIVFFGHSSGGVTSYFAAIDTINSNNYYNKDNIFVYSYGALPPGDKKFQQIYDQKVPNTYSINNGNDPLLTPLLMFGYKFVGYPIKIHFTTNKHYNHSITDYADVLLNNLKMKN